METIGFIVFSLFGVLTLRLFYLAFLSNWPDLYFSTSDFTSLFIRVSLKRFLGFRLLPVFVTSLLYTSIAIKTKMPNSIFIGALIGFSFSALSDGVVIFRILSNSKDIYTFFNKYQQLLIHCLSIFLVTLVGLLGGFVGNSKLGFILTPSMQGFVDNLWSSMFIAVFAIYLYRLYESESGGDYIIFKKSYESLGKQMVSFVRNECKKYSIDYYVILAICVVENIQRPKWFRKLEQLKSLIVKEGSYGVMQVKANKYITDEKSIRLSVKLIYKLVPKNGHGNLKEDTLKMIARKYNPSDRYAELVWDAYQYLATNADNS